MRIKPLIATNPYLKDPRQRERLLNKSVITSTAKESKFHLRNRHQLYPTLSDRLVIDDVFVKFCSLAHRWPSVRSPKKSLVVDGSPTVPHHEPELYGTTDLWLIIATPC